MAGYDKGSTYTYVRECAKCGGCTIRTINTEVRKMGQVYRKKVCSECGYRFSTVETEKIVSDVDGLLSEIEDLKTMNKVLLDRIAAIKDHVKKA